MEIIDNCVDTVFKQLKEGDTFNYGGHVFLKIKQEKEFNVVDLSSNELRKFGDKTVVIPLDGKLTVNMKTE